MAAEDASVDVNDIAGRLGLGPKLLDEGRIVAVRNEANVLTVRLRRYAQSRFDSDRAHLVLGHVAEGKTQIVELFGRRSVKEIALVAPWVGALVKLHSPIVDRAADIMAGGKAVGAKLLRESDEVGELHALVAQGARNWGSAGGIFVGELVDDAGAEAAFVVEDVVSDSEPVGDRLRVVDILSGATGSGALHRFAMVVELESDADDLGPRACRERSRHRAVDAARHGDDDARASWAVQAETAGNHCRCGAALYPKFTPGC